VRGLGIVDFSSLFEESDRIELEEPSGSPIGNVRALQIRPGGGFAIADEASDQVHLYGAGGGLERTLGRPGVGPGELDGPTTAIETPDGRVYVAQRTNRRLTVYPRDGDPTLLSVPGAYGFWGSNLGDGLVLGVASPEARFAVVEYDGSVRTRFGPVDEALDGMPFWMFLARDHATVVDGRVVTNTSFTPTLRVFEATGDSANSFGSAPPSWVEPMPPPAYQISGPEDPGPMGEWSKSFTVVRTIATVADQFVVVQYGRHHPSTTDPYHVDPTTIDVYRMDGTKLAEDVVLAFPVVGGGGELVVVTSEPSGPRTLSVYRWTGGGR